MKKRETKSMKDVISEGGFKYWFTDVFWHHHKLHLGVGLFVLLLIGAQVRAAMQRTEFDFMFAILSHEFVVSEQATMLANILRTQGFDTHGTIITLTGDPQWDSAVLQQMMIVAIDHAYAMLIIGESMLDFFNEMAEGFQHMSSLGFVTAADDPRLMDMSESRIIQDLFLISEPMFIAIKYPHRYLHAGVTVADEDLERTFQAREALRLMIQYPEGFVLDFDVFGQQVGGYND